VERDKDLTKKLRRYCRKKGIDVVGFADPNLFKQFPKYNQPKYYLKNSQTVIILGMHLYDIILDAWNNNPQTGEHFHFADSILVRYCNQVKNFLEKREYKSKIISYSPGFFLKDISALAGIGPIGKNNLLISKEFGSQVRLRALTTTATLELGTPIYKSKYCEECNKCIENCPAKAFPEGKYSKEICLPYCLSHIRMLSEHTAIWCNVCIESCPIGKIKEHKKMGNNKNESPS